jgi:NAD(P)-dependent dehydrogenase (short-subunit alcohol dehydrogenase family)
LLEEVKLSLKSNFDTSESLVHSKIPIMAAISSGSQSSFLLLGAERLIMAVKNLENGEAVQLKLFQDTNLDSSSVEVWELDMESYISVRKFATRLETLSRLDALLANAGLATTTFSLSEDNERTIIVNVVSTFLSILMLLTKLQESASKLNIRPYVSIVPRLCIILRPWWRSTFLIKLASSLD